VGAVMSVVKLSPPVGGGTKPTRRGAARHVAVACEYGRAGAFGGGRAGPHASGCQCTVGY
jgi:hypothetical protein